MSTTRVSVALAACNGERHLPAQLESIAAQSRPPDELVVCDDASDDGTAECVLRFAETAPFEVRLHVHEERLGSTRNFESAVAKTSGDVVFFADQDDVWRPAKVERLVGLLDDEPSLGAVFSNGRVTDEQGRPLGFDLWESLAFGKREQARVASGRAVAVFLRHVVAAGTTMAFRGRFRELVLPFPPLPKAHDAWVAFLVSCVSEARALDEPLIDYRIHASNQIGIRKLGLLEQLDRARQQLDEDAFGYAADFFEQARERLAGPAGRRFEVSDATRAGIEAKIRHAHRRAGMSDRLTGRLADILREAANGGYWRYSYGARSIAQDLLLR